jgi:P4 family phage/plasmid primase-like protien
MSTPNPISVALVASRTAPVSGVYPEIAWDRLGRKLQNVRPGEKDGKGWLPVVMEQGPRRGERVHAVTALVLDVEADTRRDAATGVKTVVGPEPPEPEEMIAELDQRGWCYLLHTTYSHLDPEIMPGDVRHPRYRLVFALSRPLEPDEVKPLGDHVAGILGIADCFDRGAVEPARLFYFPRVPEARLGAFEFHQGNGEPLDVDALLGEAQRVQQAMQKSRHVKPATGEGSVIEAFNAAHDVGAILESAGYIRKGRTRWLYPESTTGNPAVRLLPDSDRPRIFSDHGSDPLNDGHGHDAFDLFRILEHGGDTRVAVREAAALLGMSRAGQSLESCLDGWLQGEDGNPDLTHDQLALELSRQAGWSESARYVSGWGRWLFWDGCRWQQDEKLQHMTLTREFLRQTAEDLLRWAGESAQTLDDQKSGALMKWAKSQARLLRQAPTVASVESTARSNADLAASPDLFDVGLDLLGTPGGTVDLRTGEMRDPDPDDCITKITAVAPAPPGTRAPRWESFLRWTQRSDPEMQGFLQRLAGYALTGYTSEHKLPFLWGPGGNGKSVFINTLFGLMGDYVRRAPAETFLDNPGQRHPTDLAGLRGARLVVGSELPAGKVWNESVIKDLTGGDTITARLMRQDYFDFKPQFTLVIFGNHQPSFRGVDAAMRRRVLLIPFTAEVTEEQRDRDLEEKLKAEWPAILRWAIEGAVAWHQNGLMPPQSVIDASDEYLDAEDPIKEFVAENLIKDPRGRLPMKDLYEVFTDWSQRRGVRMVWSQAALTRTLRERGFEITRLDTGRALGGYDLSDEADNVLARRTQGGWP